MREHVRVAVVGSGFAGAAMAHRLRQAGITDFVVLERATAVGGTWRDNTYPGCACDVPSRLYSLSFAPNPGWTRSFPTQPELSRYLQGVFRDHDLLRHVRFGHEVLDARWDAGLRHWKIRTTGGALSADVLVLGAGALSDPAEPDLPGRAEFTGQVFHSARWNHDLDLTGRRVAVIGTGASAIQFVPSIQPVVEELHLFQRTPAWVMPRLDRRITAAERAAYRAVPALDRLARLGVFSVRETYVPAFVRAPWLLRAARTLATANLNRSIKDPALRRVLTPDYTMGCKRILLSNSYYPALARPNVDVLNTGLAGFTATGVVGSDGRERAVDTVIFGTGFQVGDLPIAHRVHDEHGRALASRWAEQGMAALRSTTVAGYPNMFFLVGPNTGVGHTSMVYQIESQTQYVISALQQMDQTGVAAIDPRPDVQDRWNHHLQERMRPTVWNVGGCDSWYLDEHGRNTTLWPGSVLSFRRGLQKLDLDEYRTLAVRTLAPTLESSR